MASDKKSLYEIFNDIYKNVLEQLKFSETKNSILTTIILGTIVLYIRFYIFMRKEIDESILFHISFYLLFTMLIISLYHIIKSFSPNLDNEEKHTQTELDKGNIYFFVDIAKFHSEYYLNKVKTKTGLKENQDREQLLDLSNQIISLSRITLYKYMCFKSSMVVFSFFLVFFSILFSCLYWSGAK